MGRKRSRDEDRETKEERLLRKAKKYLEERGDSGQEVDDRKSKKREKKQKRDRDYDRGHKKSRKRHHKDDETKITSSEKHERKSKKQKHSKTSRPNKARLVNLGDVLGKPPAIPLTDDDYFEYHQHFWVYLYREEGLSFNDLESESTHQAFSRFCKQYNQGALEEGYYGTLPPTALEECKTTQYTWNFRTSETEIRNLQNIQEGIHKQTEYNDQNDCKHSLDPKHVDPPSHLNAVEERNPQKLKEERYHDRLLNRRLKSHVRNTVEELGGGPKDFREKQREKRKEASYRMHAASREKEGAGVELTDSAIYGGDGDGQIGFQAALAQQKARKGQRDAKKQARIDELQSKEAKKQKDMLKMLGVSGLQAGQKIKIPPRTDR